MAGFIPLTLVLILLGAGCSSQSTYPQTAVTPTMSTEDPVIEFLVNGYLGQGTSGGGVVFASYEDLGEANGGETKYIWAAVEAYNQDQGEIKLGSGVWLPLVVHLTKKGDRYVVTSSEEPGDGNQYLPGIRRIFPPYVQAKILMRNKYKEDPLHKENLEKAQAYFSTHQTP